MNITIQEVGIELLALYSSIPMTVNVESVFKVDLIDGGLGGIKLTEKKVESPFVFSYDACEEDRPIKWSSHFNISNWGIFLAFDGEKPIGGATVAFDTQGVNMLEGRNDLAVLWDIRVDPNYRSSGVGTNLFNFAVDWARVKKCKQLKIETQNINVSACKFYAKKGCKLGVINRYGYQETLTNEEEVMLIWYLDL